MCVAGGLGIQDRANAIASACRKRNRAKIAASWRYRVYYQQNKAKLYERKKAYLARNPAKLRRWKNADYQRHRESYIARAHVGQQRIAFHFTNLQPLWAIDNIRKGARTMTVNMLGKVERDAQQSTAGSRARFDLCYVRYFAE